MWRVVYRLHTDRDLRWFWTLHALSKLEDMAHLEPVATWDEATAEFEARWKWAKMEEVG